MRQSVLKALQMWRGGGVSFYTFCFVKVPSITHLCIHSVQNITEQRVELQSIFIKQMNKLIHDTNDTKILHAILFV